MIETPIFVIDFEGSRQSGVVEYGYAVLRGGEIVEAATRLCAPTGEISMRERGQHGISKDEAAQQAPFSEEWVRFAGMRESGPFCAHNATVEDGLLRSEWACPRTSPDFSEAGKSVASWGPWLDTLHLYRQVYPQLNSHKLEDLVGTFQLQATLDQQAEVRCPPMRRRYHCALYDALASALLLQHLLNEPALGGPSLRWLFLQSAASGAARDAMGQQDLL